MDISSTIKQLDENLPQETKQIMLHGANSFLKQLMSSGGKMAALLTDKIIHRGLAPQEIEQRSLSDEQYQAQINRIVLRVTQEQLKEKLDSWANLIVSIHLKQLAGPMDVDLYTKLLEDCSIQDLVTLSFVYLGQVGDIAKPEVVPGLPPEIVKLSLHRLAAFGLLDTKFDKTGYFANETREPILADMYYTLNELGKTFLERVGEIRQSLI